VTVVVRKGQSRRLSLLEAVVNVTVGYGLAVATQMLVLEAGRVTQYGPTAQVLVALDRQKRGASAANVVQMPRPAGTNRMEQAS
jgi:hypothetical protein